MDAWRLGALTAVAGFFGWVAVMSIISNSDQISDLQQMAAGYDRLTAGHERRIERLESLFLSKAWPQPGEQHP